MRNNQRHISLSLYISLYIYTYMCIYIYISVSISLSLYIYIYRDMYIYIYIYIYTHTSIRNSSPLWFVFDNPGFPLGIIRGTRSDAEKRGTALEQGWHAHPENCAQLKWHWRNFMVGSPFSDSPFGDGDCCVPLQAGRFSSVWKTIRYSENRPNGTDCGKVELLSMIPFFKVLKFDIMSNLCWNSGELWLWVLLNFWWILLNFRWTSGEFLVTFWWTSGRAC